MKALSGLKSKMEDIISIPSRDETQAESTKRTREAAKAWRHEVVWEYTVLALSMPRDRLPAIGAIAEQFQRVRVGEAYLAGLWSGTLLEDLLWTSAPELESPKSKGRLERPFSLPTWSWASLNSRMAYHLEGATVTKAEVLEADCSYLGDREFGVLQNSKLILRGRVLHSLLKWTDADVSLCFHNGDAWTEFSDSIVGVWRLLWINMGQDQDGAQNIPPHQEYDILEISRSADELSSRTKWHLLLLRREGPDNFVYTRAGLVFLVLDAERGDGPRMSWLKMVLRGCLKVEVCQILVKYDRMKRVKGWPKKWLKKYVARQRLVCYALYLSFQAKHESRESLKACGRCQSRGAFHLRGIPRTRF